MLLVFSRLASKWYYWLKCRIYRSYNVVKIKSLTPDYHDKDLIMLHACFQLLVDYVEREKPFEIIDWGWSDRVSFIGSEIRYLYQWWKEDRAKEWKAHEQDWNFSAEQALEEKDQTNLMRLIAIRTALWT